MKLAAAFLRQALTVLYHKTPEVRVLLRRLGINHIISGPYAYDSAPCELFFSYFKR